MKCLLFLILTIFGTSGLFGAAIPGLFNTGMDASNLALVGGDGVTEIHYLVPGFSPVTYAHGSYLANSGDSRWISSGGDGDGNWIRNFFLTFNLAGLDASTAQITGSWGADNCGKISLNGVATGEEIGASGCIQFSHFQQLQPFAITSGFVAGLNMLEFKLENGGGPGAVRVDDIAGTAEIEASTFVPEPATMGLLGIGLAALALLRRRK